MTVTRVLVLHGFTQNASIFSKRIAAIRKQAAPNVEMVFIDAPHILQKADFTNSTYGSVALEVLEGSVDDPNLTPRAWWRWNPESSKAIGLEDSIIFMRDLLRSQHFDGVFGFSQGAAFAGLLSALLERPHIYPPFLVDGHPPHPPFKFCVAVAGFRFKDPIAETIYAEPFNTPTVHVVGKTDIIVTEERANSLMEVSANKRVERHDGGHFVPSQAKWRKFFTEYLQNPTHEIMSLATSTSL